MSQLKHAFVLSWLDIGNSLLINIKSCHLDKLQFALNAAAGILSKSTKFDHISPVLQKLHWLSVREWVHFRILLLIRKIVLGTAPSYLSDLITPYVPQRNLRSSHKNLLEIPKSRTAYGSRAFSSAGPMLWNNLPNNLRTLDSLETFKSKLKSFLFKRSYFSST